MKRLCSIFIASLVILLLHHKIMEAQCIPDTVHCRDTLAPGQICPDPLPGAVLNTSYNVVVTIIPPDTATINNSEIPLVKVELKSVKNLPPGITYSQAKKMMWPDTAYCGVMAGVPTTLGTYHLEIKVIPYIPILQDTVAMPIQTDNTSMVIVVSATSDVQDLASIRVSFWGPSPNPFHFTTQLGYIARQREEARLVVMTMSGQVLYQEKITASPGMNYFRYDGRNLAPGVYISTVTAGSLVHSKRLVKLE
jgi:hypothetical protein